MNGVRLPANPTVVVKVGTSSITDGAGVLAPERIARLVAQVVAVREGGARILLVSSGSIAAGVGTLDLGTRPADFEVLQAVAAVGQVKLMDAYAGAFGVHGVPVGQVLLTRYDFENRSQYLHARSTLRHLLELGVVPVVNENDTVADDEIRFGENDRLSALVAHVIAADMLVLLTDQPGLFTGDPRFDESATLIEEVHRVDAELEAVAGGAGTGLGSGGMASKLAAARMASWSGVATVIAGSHESDVLARIVRGERIGTVVRPHDRRLSSRKLWIAFAQAASGIVIVDEGAARALVRDGSLLAVGVVAHSGTFRTGDAVEIQDRAGALIGKGIVRVDHRELAETSGRRDAPVVVHRDDLVMLS
ncbi:MAG: glutamate 5-kinase [Acidimicrobiia bacterium]|nr:glutamate 5-kinase [Acidimicrobiia bacterium]